MVCNNGTWCVGLWLRGGGRKFRVFDDYQQASEFMRLHVDGVYEGVAVDEIAMWEM